MAFLGSAISLVLYPNDIYRSPVIHRKYFGPYDFIYSIDIEHYRKDVFSYQIDGALDYDFYDLTKCRRPPLYICLDVQSEICDVLENLCVQYPYLSYFVACHNKPEILTRKSKGQTNQTHYHVVLVNQDPLFKPRSLIDWFPIIDTLGMSRYRYTDNVTIPLYDGSVIEPGSDGYVFDEELTSIRCYKVQHIGAMVRYLIHADRVDKVKYPLSIIQHNNLGLLHEFFLPEMGSMMYSHLADLVTLHGWSMTRARKWAEANGCIDVFRSNFKRLYDEQKDYNQTLLDTPMAESSYDDILCSNDSFQFDDLDFFN